MILSQDSSLPCTYIPWAADVQCFGCTHLFNESGPTAGIVAPKDMHKVIFGAQLQLSHTNYSKQNKLVKKRRDKTWKEIATVFHVEDEFWPYESIFTVWCNSHMISKPRGNLTNPTEPATFGSARLLKYYWWDLKPHWGRCNNVDFAPCPLGPRN